MQIVPFPAYYQSVYTNFDFTSFSLISWISICVILHNKVALFLWKSEVERDFIPVFCRFIL